ncbi:hypothetical protein LCGC14_2054990 [marine sediment metagenome]|uniref:Uncharacterized protein n=1 Tax=marine sediment metagenome TaxID=412755 RepID=A0A0F9EMU9_9ZZZZ
MKLSELPIGHKAYTQLSSRALAVLSRRVDGWCVYVDGVPGEDHEIEWQYVASNGDKQNKTVATAIVTSLFHPGFEIDLPYAL